MTYLGGKGGSFQKLSYKNRRIRTQKKIWGPPPPSLTMLYLGGKKGVFSKVVLGIRNLSYDFWGVGEDVWRWLCRHVWGRAGAGTPIGVSGNLPIIIWLFCIVLGCDNYISITTTFVPLSAFSLSIEFIHILWMQLVHQFEFFTISI